MSSNVSESCSAEQRITDRVAEHIRIRVAEQALVERDLNPAAHKLSAFYEPVNIVACSDASRCAHFSSAKNSDCITSASRRSNGRVILMLIGEPSTTDTRCPVRSTSCDSSVPMKLSA